MIADHARHGRRRRDRRPRRRDVRGPDRRGGPKRRAVFATPQHPYTWGLLGSIPRLDRPKPRRLPTIPGLPPSLLDLPPGCAFAPRCAHALRRLPERPSSRRRATPGHLDRCFLARARSARCATRRSQPGARVTPERRAAARGARLVKHFPVKAGLLQREVAQRAGRRRRRRRGARGRDARPRRRVGLRQVDARPLPRAPARADRAAR